MAIALLQKTRGLHKVWHDVESLSLWCLLYIALHHLPHEYHEDAPFPMHIFDDIDSCYPHPEGGAPIFQGGSRKRDFLTARSIQHLHFPTAPPLEALLKQICDEFGDLYHTAYRRHIPDSEKRYKEILANLNNPMYMHAKFKEAYDSKDWLDENDWVPDQYPSLTLEKQFEHLSRALMGACCNGDDPQEADNAPPKGKKGE